MSVYCIVLCFTALYFKILYWIFTVVFLEATYNTIEEVASALQNRQVRGVLVDVFAAATRSDLFLQSDIMVKKRIQYPSAYGFVLSGDMANAAPEFRNYLSGQANSILKFMEEKASGLEVIVLLQLPSFKLSLKSNLFPYKKPIPCTKRINFNKKDFSTCSN